MLFSWEKHLRTEGKSKATVKAYGDGIRSYIKGSENAGVSGPANPRNRREAESFAAALLKDKTDGQDV